MAQIDLDYRAIIEKIWKVGDIISGRNGTTSRIINHPSIHLTSLQSALLTIRKTAWKLALREFEWFLSGSNNINDLHESVRKWWQPWADVAGYVKYNYSTQFRKFNDSFGYSFDQLQAFLDGLRTNPHGRRHCMTTWNPPEMYSKDCPITNCHGSFIQVWIDSHNTLHLFTYQRSIDSICGLPHNWIQYQAFHRWLAYQTNCTVGNLEWKGGDLHLYHEHRDVIQKIIDVRPARAYELPNILLVYSPTSNTFKANDFQLSTYNKYEPLITDTAKMIV